MKRLFTTAALLLLSLLGTANAADYRQCNIETIQKKDSFNVSMISALVLEKLAKSDDWTKAFAASDADRPDAVMFLLISAMQQVEDLTERKSGDYVHDVVSGQIDKVSEALASVRMSTKLATKGDPALVPLLVLGAGMEAGKTISDSIALIVSASLSSCNPPPPSEPVKPAAVPQCKSVVSVRRC